MQRLTKKRRTQQKQQSKPNPGGLPIVNMPAEFATLKDKGYMVTPEAILTTAECDTAMAAFEQWFVDIGTGVTFGAADGKTWVPKNLPYAIHGIIQGYGIAHTQFVWDVRQHPRVVGVFERLWGTQQLVSSYDGACYIPAFEWRGIKQIPERKPWLHYDQVCGILIWCTRV